MNEEVSSPSSPAPGNIRIWGPEHKVPPHQMLASMAKSRIDWTGKINIASKPYPFLKTALMVTIGPSSWEEATIEAMIQAGMRIARLNFGVNTQEGHLELIKKIRSACDKISCKQGRVCPLGIAVDTKGPLIRTGSLEEDEVELIAGQNLKLTTDKAFADIGTVNQIYVDYDNIQKTIRVNNKIFIDNGLITLRVLSIQGNVLSTVVEVGNKLGSRKKVNLPGVNVDLPDITEKDINDFEFAVKNEADIILVSFVRSAKAITKTRSLLGEEGKNILIFAKIQNQQGLDNIDEIIDAADGIVIVRGVLSVEIPLERLMQTQRHLIAKCNILGKPCVVCSQFLSSMAAHIKPTSAEANDLANTVNDGADCIALSSTTAKGLFPVECVTMASRICREAESAVWQRRSFEDLICKFDNPNSLQVVAIAAARLAMQVCAAAIVVATKSGKMAYIISQFHPRCLIVAVTRSKIVARQSVVYRGIMPVIYEERQKSTWRKDIEARVEYAITTCKAIGILMTSDPVVIVTPTRQGNANTVQVIYTSNTPAKIYF